MIKHRTKNRHWKFLGFQQPCGKTLFPVMQMATREENTSISGYHTALAPKVNIDTIPQQAIFQQQKYLYQNTIFGIYVEFLECIICHWIRSPSFWVGWYSHIDSVFFVCHLAETKWIQEMIESKGDFLFDISLWRQTFSDRQASSWSLCERGESVNWLACFWWLHADWPWTHLTRKLWAVGTWFFDGESLRGKISRKLIFVEYIGVAACFPMYWSENFPTYLQVAYSFSNLK